MLTWLCFVVLRIGAKASWHTELSPLNWARADNLERGAPVLLLTLTHSVSASRQHSRSRQTPASENKHNSSSGHKSAPETARDARAAARPFLPETTRRMDSIHSTEMLPPSIQTLPKGTARHYKNAQWKAPLQQRTLCTASASRSHQKPLARLITTLNCQSQLWATVRTGGPYKLTSGITYLHLFNCQLRSKSTVLKSATGYHIIYYREGEKEKEKTNSVDEYCNLQART